MLPSQHMLYGLIMSILAYLIFPSMGVFGFLVIFISSFALDADHYLQYVLKHKDWNFSRAVEYFLKMGEKLTSNKNAREPLMVFHTVEFLLILFILSSYSDFFSYVFIGVVLHMFLDIFSMTKHDVLHIRDFSIIRYYLRTRKPD